MKKGKRIFTICVCLVLSVSLLLGGVNTQASSKNLKLNNKGLSDYKITLEKGASYSIRANYKKSKLEYKTKNKKIATIDQNGKIKAKKVGTVKMSATVKGTKAKKYKVTFVVKVKKIVITLPTPTPTSTPTSTTNPNPTDTTTTPVPTASPAPSKTNSDNEVVNKYTGTEMNTTVVNSKGNKATYDDALSKEVLKKFCWNSLPNNTDADSQHFSLSKEHFAFLNGLGNSWVNGEVSRTNACNLAYTIRFFKFSDGTIPSWTLVSNSMEKSKPSVAKFEMSGKNSDAIFKKIIANYYESNGYVFIKVFYDSKSNLSTVFVINGLVGVQKTYKY